MSTDFDTTEHIGVDKDSGLVHHLKVTGANEHDSNVVADLMHGDEGSLHGDSGYLGSDKKENAITKNKNGKKIKYIINRRPSSIKKLSPSGQYRAKKVEKAKSSVRCKAEHVFAMARR